MDAIDATRTQVVAGGQMSLAGFLSAFAFSNVGERGMPSTGGGSPWFEDD